MRRSLLAVIIGLVIGIFAGNVLAESKMKTRKLSPAPAIGVHPRVFFGPEDLPDIIKRSEETKLGKVYKEQIEKHLNSNIHKEGSKEKVFYEMLVSGADVPHLQSLGYEGFARILMYEAFYALITEDDERGKTVAAALANYARNYHYEQDDHRDNITSFLMSHDVNKYMALAYDLAYNWMTAEQQDTVRREIAKMVDGREPYGWRQARWQRAYNHVGDHMFIVWANLAIEGEEGYQPELTRKTREVVRDYANLGLHESGFAAESVVYTYFGFDSTSRTMMAFAKRGENMFEDTNFRFYKNNYLYNICQFDHSKVDSHGDGGRESIGIHPIMKYMYPDDKQIDYLYSHTLKDLTEGRKGWGYFGFRWMFNIIVAVEPDAQAPADAAGMNLDKEYFCPDRGELIARTGWGKDDVKFDIECREDISVLGHQHSSRGSFYLQALGRDWVVDRGYHQAESHRHSLVHIDGVGQSGWPCGPGEVIETIQEDAFSYMACDASYAYNWSLRAAGWFDPLDSNDWERVTLPYRDKYPPEMTKELPIKERRGDGTFGHFPDTTIRKPYNTVERAIRTGMLVKGEHPYVLILDDIKKDDQRRLYQWFMQVADDLEIKSCNGKMVILGGKDSEDKAGEPRLMVRLLDVKIGEATQERTPTIPFSRAMSIELEKYIAGRNTYEGSSLNTRLTIPAISTDPHFKVLLYPFRHGQNPPVTSYNNEKLTVRLDGQEDVFKMGQLENGRTVFEFTRNGKTICEMPEGAVVAGNNAGTQVKEADKPEGILAYYDCDKIGDMITVEPGINELSGLSSGNMADAQSISDAGVLEMVKLVDGVSGKAVWMDGRWSSFKLPISLGKRTDRAQKKLTVSLWIKPDELTGAPFNDGGQRGMGIEFAQKGNFRVYTAGNWWMLTAQYPKNLTQRWTHIVLVRDGDIARLYMDGKLSAEKNMESNWWNFDTPRLGDRGYRGAIDEVRIYNAVLSAEEIEKLCRKK